MTTQSEQYDQKLRAELYEAMLQLGEQCSDMQHAEDQDDEDGMRESSHEIRVAAHRAHTAYFKCIKGGGHV